MRRVLCQPKTRNTSFFDPQQSFSLLEKKSVRSLSSTLAVKPQGGRKESSTNPFDYCSQQRWFSSVPSAPKRKGWKNKELKDWNEEDVDEWLKSQPKFEVLSKKKILEGFTGESLLEMTEEKLRKIIRDYVRFKTLVPKRLSLAQPLFNAIQHVNKEATLTVDELLQRAKSLGKKWVGKSGKSGNRPWATVPYTWVDRPFKSEAHGEFNGQEILRKLVLENYMAFVSKSTKSNDFRFFVISGASGTGKTRLGAEIPRIVQADMERLKLNIPFVYTFLLPQMSIFSVKRRARDPTGRIPRYRDDLQQAKKALAVGIASSYFLNNPDAEAQEALVQVSKDFTSLESVLKIIRKDKGLDDDTPLVLFIHMDEYQFAPQNVLAILRNISILFRKPELCCVFNPILTGVSPMVVYEVEYGCTPTAYSGTFFSLTPLNMDQSRDFVSNVFRHRTGRDLDQSILAHPHFKVVLMLAGGHIRILEYFAKELESCGVGGFETEQDTKKLIENVQALLRNIYNAQTWKQIAKPNDILELMRTAFFHEDITREMKFNGGTYGDAEQTGLFYLQPSPTSPIMFRLDFPPLLMLTLDKQFDLDIFSQDLVHGALHLEEDSFEDFLAYYLQAAFRLLAKSKREGRKTLRSIFNGWVKGDKETMELLDKEITPDPSIKVFHSPPYIPEGKLRTGKGDSKIVIRRQMKHEPVDITSGKFIIITGKRSPTGDILTPYFDAQAKWQYSSKQELTRSQVEKEAKKVRDGVPLIIFSPKQLKNYKRGGCSWLVKNVLFVVGEDFRNFMGDFYRKGTS